MKPWRRFAVPLLLTALIVLPAALAKKRRLQPQNEALTGFATPTLSENPGSQSTSNGLPEPTGDTFVEDQAAFEEADGVDKGLGPIYNARSCADCHQNPVTGGVSQVAEFRVGHVDGSGNFVNPTLMINHGTTAVPDRSLANDRAVCAEAQERVPLAETIRTFRMSLNTLGDGYVEAIDDSTLQDLAAGQPGLSKGKVHGEAIQVPILEAPGQTRIGRFGWKDQHASLLSFASDAYLNEQGITNRLNPVDLTTVCKTTTDPEDGPDATGLDDIDHFATFMRGTMAPPIDDVSMATPAAQAGQQLFTKIGCSVCHVASITTAATGTVINGGTLTVPEALGSKIIHPYGDFLLHDIGTGDGIVQNGPADTANKLRTVPLWGLRTRGRLMHDGASTTREQAILRHKGEASATRAAFLKLTPQQQAQLLAFLDAL
ncbi:MAG TPA: di-heme oxidoredictase family protein [Terriglobales bacterium]|nr:di-heme oxidoredictase family protein [Terriglobales bacterium]